MEAACYSETPEYLNTTRYRNVKEGSRLITSSVKTLERQPVQSLVKGTKYGDPQYVLFSFSFFFQFPVTLQSS
jgi:hypothetical protein